MEEAKSVEILIALGVILAIVCILNAMPVQVCEAREIKELHIGYQPSTHQIAEMIAMEKGWWAEELKRFGVEKVKDVEFESGPPEMSAMMAGELDIAYVGTSPPITVIDKGLDAKIVAGVQNKGSDLVLLPELAANYTSPEDLKGLKIATSPAGSIQYTILNEWLLDNGLDPDKDVDIREMLSGEAISAIEARAVDGVFLPAPSPTIIEEEGAGKKVVQSGKMWPDHACCCLLVSGELIREHPELVEQIIRIHINATEYIKEHPDEAAEVFAKKTGFDLEKTKKSFTRTDMEWVHDPYPQISSGLEYARVNYEMELTNKLLTEEDLYDTSFYDRIMGIAPPPLPSPSATPTPYPGPDFSFYLIIFLVFSLAIGLPLIYFIYRKGKPPSGGPKQQKPPEPEDYAQKIKEYRAKMEEWEKEGYDVSELKEVLEGKK